MAHPTEAGAAKPQTWQGAGAPAAEMGDADVLLSEFGPRKVTWHSAEACQLVADHLCRMAEKRQARKPPSLVQTMRMEAERRRRRIRRLIAYAVAVVIWVVLCWTLPAASAEIPVPVYNPEASGSAALPAPWWFTHLNCVETRKSLEVARKQRSQLLYWAKLPSWGEVGLIGQLWGSYSGDIGEASQSWIMVVQTSTGLTCRVANGSKLPGWALEIGGVRA